MKVGGRSKYIKSPRTKRWTRTGIRIIGQKPECLRRKTNRSSKYPKLIGKELRWNPDAVMYRWVSRVTRGKGIRVLVRNK